MSAPGPAASGPPPKAPGAQPPRPDRAPTAPPPTQARSADPPATDRAGRAEQAAPQSTSDSAAAGSPEPTGKQPPSPPAPVVIADRASTATEQARFSADAGEAFTDALATVNAALATWPALRQSDAGAKTDYVAVCLYLGRGDGGAVRLNEALRAGTPAPFEGYVPCLVSGIRRLQTHRRALLRQCVLGAPVEQRYPVGSVLTTPDFLSASVALDVTVPGADLDMLIWPYSARRTSELGLNRPIDEAVFLASRRFKALAVRTSNGDSAQEEEQEGPRAPRTAVFVRELSPDEEPGTSEVDSRDQAALAKLERAWERRQRAAVRAVDDPDIVARLTTPMMDAGVDAEGPTAGAAAAAVMS
ncbi:MAG TPA: hypothetical protein VFG87_17690 [Amycolatopsis sp.]|nr:hypothetical protein [Amycolatopsis sp.]